MNLTTEERLAIMLDTTEDQQKAINTAITKLNRLPSELKEPLTNAVKNAVGDAIAPLLQSLASSTTKAAEEKKQLNRTIAGFTWKFAGIAFVITAGAACALIFAVYGAVAWQRHELESLTAQKAEMEANIAKLDKVKGSIKLDTCTGRPCVEVDGTGFTEGKKIFYWMKGVY